MCEPLRGKLEELENYPWEGEEFSSGYGIGVRDSFDKFKSAVEFYKKYRMYRTNTDFITRLKENEPDAYNSWSDTDDYKEFSKMTKHQINIELLAGLKVGDWILSLNNFATEKISADEAKSIINLYNYD